MNFLLFLLLLVMGMFLYILYRRVISLSLYINKTNRDIEVLYKNQKILESDLQKTFNEFQNAKKEISKYNTK